MASYFNVAQMRRLGMDPSTIESLRQIQSNADQAQADATAAAVAAAAADAAAAAAQSDANTAQTSADLASTIALGKTLVWNSDFLGVFPAGNPTQDLIVPFFRLDVEVSSRTINAALNSTTGFVTLTSGATSGEANTVAIYGNGTTSARAEITNTASSIIGVAAASSVDNSTPSQTPGTITGGGGGGGGAK